MQQDLAEASSVLSLSEHRIPALRFSAYSGQGGEEGDFLKVVDGMSPSFSVW